MFGVNLNFTAKDVSIYMGLPVAIGTVVLISRVALAQWSGAASVSRFKKNDLVRGVVLTGIVGAGLGSITAYLSGQRFGKDALKTSGCSMGAMLLLTPVNSLLKPIYPSRWF